MNRAGKTATEPGLSAARKGRPVNTPPALSRPRRFWPSPRFPDWGILSPDGRESAGSCRGKGEARLLPVESGSCHITSPPTGRNYSRL